MKTFFYFIATLLFITIGCKPDSTANVEDSKTDPTIVELVRDSTVMSIIDSVILVESDKPLSTPKIQDAVPANDLLPNNQSAKVADQQSKGNKLTSSQPPIKVAVNQADLISKEAYIVFNEMEHAFETVKEGENIKHKFEFQNLGKKPLVISNASSACSCTFAEFPLEPIMPGQNGEISALFTTKGFYGKQVKTINVTSNAENDLIQLRITGLVQEVEAFSKEREEKTKQWEKNKMEMEKQQQEMKKALEIQKRKDAIADSILKANEALLDSTNTDD